MRSLVAVAAVILVVAVLWGIALSIQGPNQDQHLALMQTLIMAVEVPVLIAGLGYLIRNAYLDNVKPEVEFGVVQGVIGRGTAPEVFEKSAEADQMGQFTLLFRNKSRVAISDIQLGIHARDDSGNVYRICGLDDVHVEPEAEFQTLRTTSNWSYLTPDVPHTLSLMPHGSSPRGVEITVTVVVLRANRRVPPGPFQARVIIPKEEPWRPVYA